MLAWMWDERERKARRGAASFLRQAGHARAALERGRQPGGQWLRVFGENDHLKPQRQILSFTVWLSQWGKQTKVTALGEAQYKCGRLAVVDGRSL